MDDNKFWLGIWISIVVGLVTVILGACYLENQKIIRAMELGYEKQSLPGQNYSEWHRTVK